jgi:hypothetical protein
MSTIKIETINKVQEDVTNINGYISNATMSHTSNDISNTDFIIRDLDLNQEPAIIPITANLLRFNCDQASCQKFLL